MFNLFRLLFKKKNIEIQVDYSSYSFIRESEQLVRADKERWLDELATDEQKSAAYSFIDLESLVLGKVTLEEFKENKLKILGVLQGQNAMLGMQLSSSSLQLGLAGMGQAQSNALVDAQCRAANARGNFLGNLGSLQ